MGFAETIHTVFTRRYAKFTGRAARSEFWWFCLFYVGALIGLSALLVALGGGDLSDPRAIPMSALLVLVLMGLFVLASVVPMIAVTVRRLHDRNLSGWWYLGALVASFIPIVGWLASIAMLLVCALPGTAGPNRFGEAPLTP